jgi:hypothetical protein
MGDIGAVGYFSDREVIDTHGLNEPAIALSGVRDPQYVLSKKPDLVAVVSRDPKTFRARSSSLPRPSAL